MHTATRVELSEKTVCDATHIDHFSIITIFSASDIGESLTLKFPHTVPAHQVRAVADAINGALRPATAKVAT